MRAVEFKKSFDRTYEKLSCSTQLKVDEAIEGLLTALEHQKVPHGLGLKRLQENQWEIRVNLNLRVGFKMVENRIEFGIVGTHDTIKKYLKK